MSVLGVILVQMRENADQNNSEYGHFSRSARLNRNLTFFLSSGFTFFDMWVGWKWVVFLYIIFYEVLFYVLFLERHNLKLNKKKWRSKVKLQPPQQCFRSHNALELIAEITSSFKKTERWMLILFFSAKTNSLL